jgi:hypothetical protein
MTDGREASRFVSGDSIALNLLTALVLLANVLWYRAKFILRRRNYPVSWFWNHYRDLPNLWRASCEEGDERARIRLRMLLGGIVACLLTAVAVFFAP